ncbi:uncharacterized protein LOC109821753 [Asparagus officinalis]|uniref:uncharacterized protein LOC109821753 n=1 Tax=Asparagus officinalis TaxID=4686 RepID=UPI00098E0D78|nr:uncharacterized protein LOC109821753 [Asparagus officinalis]
MNLDWHEFGIVKDHLVRYGIMVSYKIWLHHGELPDNYHGDSGDDRDESDDDNRDEYPELMEDHCRGTYMDDDDVEMDHDVRNFEKLLEASQREMYPGCKNFTLLAFVVKMLHVKVENRWSNKSFDMILQIFRDLLPEGHLVPGESRYKFIGGNGMKIPRKVLCYFPLTPRLRRLYMSRKTATEMRWYRDKRVDDGIMRHPADTEEWKEFDLIHPDFAKEIRNVRLGLASDGFNPFGNMSNAYSMWPVILMPYNLPPWLCMKESFFMMSLLIPGPHAPGNDIDVFLRPLVDELKELWDNGVVTYDASKKEIFRMHAAILWTINDFPAYGNLSGWSTKGYLACPPCNDDPLSHRLRSKIGYFGHRVYLPRNHTMRRSKDFNGRTEHHMKSLELPVEKVLEQLDQLPNVNFGKHPLKRKRPYESIALNWRKKSIFFELPYWKELKVRHNLDPMHIEKNICEAIIGTMLGIDGKNKDTSKARLDLEDMDIRSKLHLEKQPDGSIRKPIASYTLSPEEREGFCAFLASIKYPDGYAANLSRTFVLKH